jgi:drug/metabolite transporter (DMT)-like permease
MIGEAMALASALCWSVSVILFRRLFARGEGISPFAMNLFKNVVAIVFMAALLLVTGGTLNTDRSAEAWLRLIVSGILGIGVSDMLFFHALRRLGPGRLTVVECLYSPAVALFGVLLLGEVPTPAYALGAGLVVAGMLVVTRDERGKGADTGESPLSGALFGMGAMLTVALAIVVAKPAFDTGSLVEVALIRILSGTGALLLWMLPSAERRAAVTILRPSPLWGAMLPATLLGTCISMLFWVGGFKYTDAATAAVLNQTTTVFTLLLARMMLGEPLTPRRVAGVVLGFSGAVCVMLVRVGP